MLKLLPILLIVAPLLACQSQKATDSGEIKPSVVSDFCLVSQPFRWSKLDTPETILQAKKINAQGVALCNWKTN